MGQLFIRYTDGVFEITKKTRIDDSEARKLKEIMEHFLLKPELIEVQEYSTTTFSFGGYTYYLNDDYKFDEIMRRVETVLLKNTERKRKTLK